MAQYECEHTTSDKKLKEETDNFPSRAFAHGVIVGAAVAKNWIISVFHRVTNNVTSTTTQDMS